MEEKYFIDNLKKFVKKIIPYTNDSIIQIYNFCYINKYKLKNNLLEIFIGVILTKKNFSNYLFQTLDNDIDYKFIIELNLTYVTLCEKYNFFLKTKEFIKNNYLNNEFFKNKYSYQNNYYKLLENNEESIDI